MVAQAAKAAISIRYKLIDYLYTAFHKAHLDGTPVVQPLFFVYPKDVQTFSIDHQFFFGDAILVSPVLDESNEVEIYLPDDIFYDFQTRRSIPGSGEKIWVRQVAMDEIPLLIRGGVVLPLRSDAAMTTKELREKNFELVVAPGMDGSAKGNLYIDDGISLVQDDTLEVEYMFDGSRLVVSHSGTYDTGSVVYSKISILSVDEPPSLVQLTGADGRVFEARRISWDEINEVLTLEVGVRLDKSFSVSLYWETGEDEAHEHVKSTKVHERVHDEL